MNTHQSEVRRKNSSTPPLLWLIWVSIGAMSGWMAVRGFGRLSGDTVLDWLAVHGAANDLKYGLPVGVLAEHFGVELPPWDGTVTSYSAWIHPRSPGALLLSSPLLILEVQQAVDIGRIVAALGWTLLATALIVLIVTGNRERIGLLMLLLMATPPVLMLIEYAPQIALISVIVGVAWVTLRRHDGMWIGALLGVVAILRPTFGVLAICLFFARRTRAATALVVVWAMLEVIGGVVFDVSPGDFLAMSRDATVVWAANPTNGSFLAQLHGFGFGIVAAAALTGVLCMAAIALLVFRHRREVLSVDMWIAVAVGAAVLLSPVGWNHYLVMLILPCAWAMRRLPRALSVVAATALAILLTISIWVWFNGRGQPIWGDTLALTLLAVLIVIYGGALTSNVPSNAGVAAGGPTNSSQAAASISSGETHGEF